MDADRVGPNRFDQPRDAVDPDVASLDRTDVCEQQNIRRDFSDLKGLGGAGIDEHRALGTDSHGQAKFLGGCCQRAIEFAAVVRSAGHTRDHKRCLQSTAEQLDRKIDVRNREFGQ